IYIVEDSYKNLKKQLNKFLVTAIFTERVLLIEGPSERILFEKILSEINPEYELEGAYILEVFGITFKKYRDILTALNIKVFVKTDNDLKGKRGSNKYDLLGINRGLELVNKTKKAPVTIKIINVNDKKEKYIKLTKKKLEIFSNLKFCIKNLKKNDIYISEIDLEHDLEKALGKDRLKDLLGKEEPVKYLQAAKLINMVELSNILTKDDCEKIFNDERFLALKRLVENIDS
ncbi:ATP-dependent endonuclease, partial [Lysinibacillus sp. CNPSo 3705]|uniref:ATP-dependent endonuclease n=1 Tax=Lysinibacillus sp. CNPSo 3705 TaxID=3028148 RepID=UPI0023647DF9